MVKEQPKPMKIREDNGGWSLELNPTVKPLLPPFYFNFKIKSKQWGRRTKAQQKSKRLRRINQKFLFSMNEH